VSARRAGARRVPADDRPGRDRHPSTRRSAPAAPADAGAEGLAIPADGDAVVLPVDGRAVRLTNLRKVFWPELGVTKGELLQYYADVAPVLLPHLRDRAMVMRRYPDGAAGPSFFMKRAPTPRPDWIETCAIRHGSGNVIEFPMVQDRAALLWCVNLGCIDLNQWYARCDDVDRPDYLHVDLDPGSATFAQVREAALLVHEALAALGMPDHVKTTGSRGLHVTVPIARGPSQHEVWEVSKALAEELARRRPDLVTAEYRVRSRPAGRVLLDYNQNAWGRTLASVYSVRPHPRACVSTPVTWEEVARGIRIEDFRIDNVRARLADLGDLWAAVPAGPPRYDLGPLLGARGGRRRRAPGSGSPAASPGSTGPRSRPGTGRRAGRPS
jgi:bifunctional non-homologous end joining protein LigD